MKRSINFSITFASTDGYARSKILGRVSRLFEYFIIFSRRIYKVLMCQQLCYEVHVQFKNVK